MPLLIPLVEPAWKLSVALCRGLATAFTAAYRATPAQRATIEANYGKDDDACIAEIKRVYAELGLEQVFHEYEDRAYAETCAAIDAACDGGSMPRAVFNMVLSKIYKRKA